MVRQRVAERVEWGRETKKTLLPVQWTDVAVEDVPIVSATALEILAVDRFVQFHAASQSESRELFARPMSRKRPTPVLTQFS